MDTELNSALSHGGELGALISEYDWSQTPLGPISSWPQSLKTAVRICVVSRNPMVLWWGRSTMTQIYNDGYISVLGSAKHPRWLGGSGYECWSEIMETMGPMWDDVFSTSEATWSEDFLYVLNRNLPREEAYFTFSYTPLWDDQGNVAGIICPCYETTARVIGERRLSTLRQLGEDTAAPASTVQEVCRRVAETLSRNPHDVPFALFYMLSETGNEVNLVARAGIVESHAFAPMQMLAQDINPWPSKDALEGKTMTLIELESRGLPGAPWPEPANTSTIFPIFTGQNRAAGFVVLGASPRRVFDDDYLSFLNLIGDGISSAATRAHGREQDRKRAEALAELDRAKTAFFSNVSHEFRTPLTLILGPLRDLLASQMSLTPIAIEQLDIANRNGARLLRLVNTLLDFSRIEAGRVRAVYRATDIAAFTAELASVFRSAIERAGMRLKIDCETLNEPAYLDTEMWEKIVLNLISNAFKFTFEGQISVSIRQVNHAAELRVSDTGVGIPSEEIPRLFERFHCVENTRSRTHEGSGIGLALVQELVKLHGGSIHAESKLGQGAAFIVNIPLGQDRVATAQVGGDLASTEIGAAAFVEEALRWLPDAPSADRAQEPVHYDGIPVPRRAVEPASGDPRQRVLIADDNSDMRLYLARLLNERYDVEVAANGQAALQAIHARPPNLLLTDVMMPGLDGIGLLRELRNDAGTRGLPVILLSARAGEESRIEGLDAGADDYLIKPFSSRELMARVSARLEIARLQREKQQQTANEQAILLQNKEHKRHASILQERARLARDIHDTLAQGFTGIVLNLELAEDACRDLPHEVANRITRAKDVARASLEEARRSIFALASPTKDLMSSLRELVDRCRMNNQTPLEFSVSGFPTDLGLAATENVVRIVQQGVDNAQQHARATMIRLEAAFGPKQVRIRIRDDGRGFDVSHSNDRFGLKSMRERAAEIGAAFRLRSRPGRGTQIDVTVPISFLSPTESRAKSLRSSSIRAVRRSHRGGSSRVPVRPTLSVEPS